MAPKNIPRLNISSATPLTAMQLNDIRFSDRHTILTPDMLKPQQPAAAQNFTTGIPKNPEATVNIAESPR